MQQFEQSLELANVLDDQPSQQAIKKALEEVNARIVDDLNPQEGSSGAIESNVEVDPVH